MNSFGQLAQQLRQLWNGMSLARRAAMLGVLALAMAVVLGVGYWASQPDYRVLFTGLSPEDAGAITGKLQAQNVPYRLEGGGSTLLVPAEQLSPMRVLLAADDLPGKGGRGFELFDQSPMGMTPFNQQVNYLRALQAELARTIMQIEPVVHARVHLVRPDPSPFLRDQKPTTASVIVRLKPGATLNRNVATGIVALVARSVEGLPRENVTLVDTNGRVLSEERAADDGGVGAQLDKRRELERELSARAESMLAKAVGPGRAIVRVTADVNFKQFREKKVTVSQEGSAKKSESTTSTKKTPGGGTQGSAGTAGNLGRPNAPRPTPSASDTEETIKIEYVVPETIQDIVDNKEEVQRLTIAALVDLSGDEQEAKTESRMSLADAEELIKRAVGFKVGRDDIKVTQVRMSGLVPSDLTDQEWATLQRWQSIAMMLRHGSLGMAALAALAIGWMALRRVRTEPGKDQAPAPAPERNPVLDRMVLTAQQDPEALARVLAHWLEQTDRPQRRAA